MTSKMLMSLAAAVVLSATTALADGAKITVAFTGKAPAMPELKRSTDPFCAKTKMKDEEVLVSDGKLANALVRVVKGAKAEAGTGELHVDQKDCMYRPRVSAAVGGQTIVVKNTDKTLHNVHTYVGQKTVFNRAQPEASAEIKHPLKDKDRGSIIKFKCDVHPWMVAWVAVNDNPFVGVTDTKGAVTFDKLPPGTYTVEAWHERYGAKTVDLTVEAGKTAEAKVEYTGSEAKPSL